MPGRPTRLQTSCGALPLRVAGPGLEEPLRRAPPRKALILPHSSPSSMELPPSSQTSGQPQQLSHLRSLENRPVWKGGWPWLTRSEPGSGAFCLRSLNLSVAGIRGKMCSRGSLAGPGGARPPYCWGSPCSARVLGGEFCRGCRGDECRDIAQRPISQPPSGPPCWGYLGLPEPLLLLNFLSSLILGCFGPLWARLICQEQPYICSPQKMKALLGGWRSDLHICGYEGYAQALHKSASGCSSRLRSGCWMYWRNIVCQELVFSSLYAQAGFLDYVCMLHNGNK